jgi:hypothetical protein
MSTPPPDYSFTDSTSGSTLHPSALPRQQHPHLHMTLIQDLHPVPPPPSARPDFVAAAMRTPRDYDLIAKALRQHDNEAMFRSVAERMGPIRTGSLLGLHGHGFGDRKEWKSRLDDPIPVPDDETEEAGNEGEERRNTLMDDPEEDEEAGSKRKKKKKKGKKSTVPKEEEEVKPEVPDVVEPGASKGKAKKKGKKAKPTPIAVTKKEEEEVEKQLQAAEEGSFGTIPSPSGTYDSEESDAATIRAKSRRISPELSADVSRSATPKPAEFSKDASVPEVSVCF